MTQLARDESGQTMLEYALIIGCIVTLGLMLGLTAISGSLGAMLDAATQALS